MRGRKNGGTWEVKGSEGTRRYGEGSERGERPGEFGVCF